MKMWVVAVCLSAVAAQAQSAKCPEVTRIEVKVKGSNDEWTPTGLKVEKGDIVLIEAEGKVKVGEWIGEVSADGDPSALGKLFMKVGDGAKVSAGKRFFVTADSAGALKVKVNDTKYEDNQGEFAVTVTKVPSAAVVPAKIAVKEE